MLNKHSNRIYYHFVREVVAMKEYLTTPLSPLNNWADLLTKVLSEKKRRNLFSGVLYDIYDYGQVSAVKSASLIRGKLEETSKLPPIRTYLSNIESTLALELRSIIKRCHATHTTYFLRISVYHLSLSHGNVAIITTVFLIL